MSLFVFHFQTLLKVDQLCCLWKAWKINLQGFIAFWNSRLLIDSSWKPERKCVSYSVRLKSNTTIILDVLFHFLSLFYVFLFYRMHECAFVCLECECVKCHELYEDKSGQFLHLLMNNFRWSSNHCLPHASSLSVHIMTENGPELPSMGLESWDEQNEIFLPEIGPSHCLKVSNKAQVFILKSRAKSLF